MLAFVMITFVIGMIVICAWGAAKMEDYLDDLDYQYAMGA